MAEYIDRDMFLKIISHKPSSPTTDREDRLINGLISAVKNCPAADVRPVVHGKWLDRSSGWTFNSECNKCGFIVHEQFIKTYMFCPNCGARMVDD